MIEYYAWYSGQQAVFGYSIWQNAAGHKVYATEVNRVVTANQLYRLDKSDKANYSHGKQRSYARRWLALDE